MPVWARVGRHKNLHLGVAFNGFEHLDHLIIQRRADRVALLGTIEHHPRDSLDNIKLAGFPTTFVIHLLSPRTLATAATR
jgi:hypothetical protein